METKSVATVVAAILIASFARLASAQNADAEALFSDAERLEKTGKVNEACNAFEASNRIEPRAGTMIRLAACREAQGRLASAWSAYKDSLTRAKDPTKRQIAEAKIKELEPRLSYLTVVVPDASRIEGLAITRNGVNLDPALWNRAMPVDGGTYVLVGKAPGHEGWSANITVGNEAAKARIEVPRFKSTPVPTAPMATAEEPSDDEADEPVATPSAFTTKRKIAIGVTGVAVAAAAAGAVLGMQAKKLKDEAYDLCPDAATPCAAASDAQSKLDRGRDRARFANIGFGVAGAALVGAVVLWFTGGPEGDGTLAGAHAGGGIGSGGAQLDLTWRF